MSDPNRFVLWDRRMTPAEPFTFETVDQLARFAFLLGQAAPDMPGNIILAAERPSTTMHSPVSCPQGVDCPHVPDRFQDEEPS